MIGSRAIPAGKRVCGVACVLACLAVFAPWGFARTWSDASGKFNVEADLVSVEENQVTLKRTDGKLIHLPIDKLSQADQNFLAKNKPSTAPAGPPSESPATPHVEPSATASQPDIGDAPAAKRVNAKQDAKQIAAAEQAVDELYKADLAGARTLQQRSALAQKIIQISSTESESNSKYALAHRGALIAASVGDTRATFAGMRDVEAAYDDPLPIWIESLEILLVHNPDDLVPVSEELDLLIPDAIAKNDFVAAAKLATLSSAAARLSKDPGQITAAKFKAAEVATAKDEAKKFAAAEEQLKQNAADPAAKAVAGRYLCLVRRDWDHGLPLLNGSNDKVLQPIAAAELKANKTPADLAALGDYWFAAAKKVPLHTAAQARGFYWYQQALPQATGLAKIKIEKELAGHELKVGMDLLARVDTTKDAAGGRWAMDGHSLVGDSTGQDRAKISLPTPTGMTRYELSLELTDKGTGAGVMIFLPVGERSIALRLGAKRYGSDGLERLDGMPSYTSQNPTNSSPGTLDVNQRCLVVIDVIVKGSDAEIQVETNKKKIISWKGPMSQLDVYASYAPPHRDRIGLAVLQDVMIFHSIRLVYAKGARPNGSEGP